MHISVFYTREGCLDVEGLSFGDPTLNCNQKATAGEDFEQLTMENDGQWDPIHMEVLGLDVTWYYIVSDDVGDLDYIPIQTIDDCDVESNEVFSVFGRSQYIIDSSGRTTPDFGFETLLIDNDGKTCGILGCTGCPKSNVAISKCHISGKIMSHKDYKLQNRILTSS